MSIELADLAGSSLSRRAALFKGAAGLGAVALEALLRPSLAKAEGAPVKAKPGRALNVISLFMKGGPSQVDLFDPKPVLRRLDGQKAPFELFQRSLKGTSRLMGSPFKFSKHGQCGTEISELLPGLAGHVDDIALIRSATTTRFDHDQAQLAWLTGRPLSGFPTVGSWVSYGLGRINENLPAYVAMGKRSLDWASGFLPPDHQATPLQSRGTPFFDLAPPKGATESHQTRLRDSISMLNRKHAAHRPESADLKARILQFELAARMQVAATDLADLSGESEASRRLYGLERDVTRDFGTQCLLARRLVERGVRFVHIVDGQKWDHHGGINEGLPRECLRTDGPVAGLLSDLKQRGMLDSTLVVWAGEFGRLPTVEGKGGRDHNPHAFSMWMAGGGIKGGVVHGATDDFGYAAVENKVTVADIHATILQCLGIEVNRLTYEFDGRAETLVGVSPSQVLRTLMI